MAYRRDRSIREVYEERFLPDRPGPYPRGGGAPDRRAPFRPDEEYNRGGYEYEGGPRFFPNGGGPRSYHGDDQRGYHGDGHHFPADRRSGPPSRREEYPYRVPREDPHAGRPMEFSNRAPPPPAVRNPALYPAPRTLPAVVPEGRDDTLMQAILNLDRSEERDHYRRKVSSFAPIRERSPVRTRDAARSPHSRSGSSVSSRGYSPDRAKGLPFPSQQGKNVDEGHASITEHLWGALFSQQSGLETLDKVPGLSTDASPQSTTSNKDEPHAPEVEKEEAAVTTSTATVATTTVVAAAAVTVEESHKTVTADDFQERRSLAIAAKAQEIEKVYRQDCETFGMVVKMLVAKDPSLEKQLQVPLRENLGEIRERCLEDLKHYISDLDEMARQPEPAV